MFCYVVNCICVYTVVYVACTFGKAIMSWGLSAYKADSKMSALFNTQFYAGVLAFPKTEEPPTILGARLVT